MADEPPVPNFAPDDPTDGRPTGEWQTRYPDPECQREIRFERNYLLFLLFVTPVLLILLQLPKAYFEERGFDYFGFLRYAYAWLGGLLGGTLFDIKWLYHTVARHLWNVDRRLWRLFVPHISGTLAFAVVLMISSGIVRIFDPSTLRSLSVCLAMGFMVGLFSDNATAKLKELGETLFGATHKPSIEGRKEVMNEHKRKSPNVIDYKNDKDDKTRER